jgi:hypothetical protein
VGNYEKTNSQVNKSGPFIQVVHTLKFSVLKQGTCFVTHTEYHVQSGFSADNTWQISMSFVPLL